MKSGMITKSVALILMTLAVHTAGAIGISLPQITGTVGDEVEVAITIADDLTGQNIESYQLMISFNASYAEFISATKTGTISAPLQSFIVNEKGGKVHIVGAGAQPLVGSGELVKLKFKLIRATSLSLVFFEADKNNYFNEGSPAMEFTNGRIQIQNPPNINVRPDVGELAIGEKLKFTVGGGTAPYSWSTSDNLVASIESDGTLSALSHGEVKVIAQDQNGFVGQTDQSVVVRSFKTVIRDTSYYQRNTVDIPFLFYNLDGTDVHSADFTITYNTSVLTFEEILMDESVLSRDFYVNHHHKDGQINISIAGQAPTTKSGIFFQLRFKIADKTIGSTYLEITKADVNETLKAKAYKGRFSITALPKLTLKPLTADLLAGEEIQFTVTGGTPPYTWKVNNSNGGDLDASGFLKALMGGELEITVSDMLGSFIRSTRITVHDSYVTIPNINADVKNRLFEIPVALGPLPQGTEIHSVGGKLSYNAPFVDSIKIVPKNTLTEGWINLDKTGVNNTRFALTNDTPIKSQGTLIKLQVHFNKSVAVGNQFYINFDNLLLNEGFPSIRITKGLVKVTSVVGVHNLKSPTFKLYPNPAKSFIQIEGISISNIILYNILGEQVYSNSYPDIEQKVELSLSGLHAGIYFIKINNSDTRKIRIIR